MWPLRPIRQSQLSARQKCYYYTFRNILPHCSLLWFISNTAGWVGLLIPFLLYKSHITFLCHYSKSSRRRFFRSEVVQILWVLYIICMVSSAIGTCSSLPVNWAHHQERSKWLECTSCTCVVNSKEITDLSCTGNGIEDFTNHVVTFVTLNFKLMASGKTVTVQEELCQLTIGKNYPEHIKSQTTIPKEKKVQ